MPQYNKNELETAARKYGFIRDTFEKVIRLEEILSWISSHEYLKDHLLLKGGTAINLTIFNLPRLSVDIDMDYIPNSTLEEMSEHRAIITDLITRYMKSEGYTLSDTSRFHHSLDSFCFNYTNSAGNRDMIKIELNYSMRAHIFEPAESVISTGILEESIRVSTLDPIEIFAGKANALLSRAAARDLYDFNNMIKSGLHNDNREMLKKSILFYISVSKDSLDDPLDYNAIDRLTFQTIRRDLFPVLQYNERHAKFDLDEMKNNVIKYIKSLMQLTSSEEEYLLDFQNKEYRPDLLFDDEAIVQRIQNHPMALWKCRCK